LTKLWSLVVALGFKSSLTSLVHDDASMLQCTAINAFENYLLLFNCNTMLQIFHWEIIRQNRAFHYFPEDVVPQMFCNMKSIYQFHNDFLLPQLEQRMSSW